MIPRGGAALKPCLWKLNKQYYVVNEDIEQNQYATIENLTD